MDEENTLIRTVRSITSNREKTGSSLTGINRVEDDGLKTSKVLNSIGHVLGGKRVSFTNMSVVNDDFVVIKATGKGIAIGKVLVDACLDLATNTITLRLCIETHADANDGGIDASSTKTGENTRVGTSTSRAGDDGIPEQAGFPFLAMCLLKGMALLNNFGSRYAVTQGTHLVGPTTGNDVRLLSVGLELGNEFVLDGSNAAERSGDLFGAKQSEGIVVAASLWIVRSRDAFLENDVALHTLSGCRRSREAAVVGLHSARCDKNIRSLIKRFLDEKV